MTGYSFVFPPGYLRGDIVTGKAFPSFRKEFLKCINSLLDWRNPFFLSRVGVYSKKVLKNKTKKAAHSGRQSEN